LSNFRFQNYKPFVSHIMNISSVKN